MAKILLLEDQTVTGLMTEAVLKEAGHTVNWQRDGEAGLRSFAVERPDLVITDIIMPVMDGIEFIQALRAKHPDFPIIALSSGGPTGGYELLEIVRSLGVEAVIRKPPSDDELLSAVDRCLEDAAGHAGP